MNGYYDYHPPRYPEIPIALIGFFGAGHDRIGNQMAAMTGLPYTELDRSIEHSTGRSVAQLVLEEGESSYRATERDRLQRALEERPAGIIVLGEGALADPTSRALVAEKSVLVYVHREPDELAARLRSQQERFPATGYPWFPAAGFCDNDFETLRGSRALTYEDATLRVQAAGRRSDAVATEVIQLLKLGSSTH